MARTAISIATLLMFVIGSSLPSIARAHTRIGGSSTIVQYVNAFMDAWNVSGNYWHGSYGGTNSKTGINKFISEEFYMAISIRPFTSSENTQYPSKLTIPFGIVTVSPFTSSATTKGFTLNAGQVANILTGKTTSWNQLPGSALSGPITVVIRSDEAAVTALVNDFLRAALGSKWKFTGEGPFNFGAKTVAYAGNATVAGKIIKSIPGSFGFLQSGIGYKTYGLNEILLKNRAGKAVGITKSPKGTVSAAIPKSPPSFSGPWNAKSVSAVWKSGTNTYPIVAFAYAFFRTKYPATNTGPVKSLGAYMLSNAGQNLGNTYYVFSLPSNKYLAPAKKAVNAITSI